MAVIRQKTQMFNQPIGVVRASTGGEQIGQAISRFAGDIQQRTFEVAAEDAQQRGIDTAKAIEEKNLHTFNPETGKPEAFVAPKGMGRIASQAYQQIVDARFEESMQSELRNKAQEIAVKFPYDADGYENVMSKYIESMHLNATGKYKEFIVESGSDFLAQTKTNIQAKATAKARADLADSLVSSLTKGNDSARALAAAGGFITSEGELSSESDDAIAKSVSSAQNGVNSSLLKRGADQSTLSDYRTSTALGGVGFILSKTNSSAERNAVALAIRTGKSSNAPKELKSKVEALLKYVDPSNVDVVARQLSASRSAYDAVEQDKIVVQEAIAERESRQRLMTLGMEIDAFGDVTSDSASSAYNSEEPLAVNGSIKNLDNIVSGRIAVLDGMFIDGDIKTEAALNSRKTDVRHAAMRPYLIQGAADGNISEFKAAMISNNPADMQKLTPNQISVISALHSSNFIYDTNSNDDQAFVTTALSGTVNSAREARDKANKHYNLSLSVSDLSETASMGRADSAVVSKVANDIRSEIGSAISAPQGDQLLGRLLAGQAIGDLNLFGPNASAASLNRISAFVSKDGTSAAGMTNAEVALGQRILSNTTDLNKKTITGHIDNLRVKANAQETINAAENAKNQNMLRVSNGGGVQGDTKDQNLQQERFDTAGINLGDPSSETPQVLAAMKSVVPTNVLTAWGNLASGVPTAGAETMMNHYARLRYGASNTGKLVNHLGNSVSATQQAFLDDVLEIRNTVGGGVADIAQTLKERRETPSSKDAAKRALQGKTPTKFVLDFTDGFFTSPDPILAQELNGAAEYLALSGKSTEQIEERLGAWVETKYPKAPFIADQRMPLGELTRSQYGLDAQIPDDADRQEFLRIIESNMPEGYSLFAGSNGTGSTYGSAITQSLEVLAPAMGKLASTIGGFAENDKTKQVMLVPYEGSAGPSYVAHFINDYNELEPLIFNKGVRPENEGSSVEPSLERGGDILPMFDLSALEKFRKERADNERTTLLGEIKDQEDIYIERREDLDALQNQFNINTAVMPRRTN